MVQGLRRLTRAQPWATGRRTGAAPATSTGASAKTGFRTGGIDRVGANATFEIGAIIDGAIEAAG